MKQFYALMRRHDGQLLKDYEDTTVAEVTFKYVKSETEVRLWGDATSALNFKRRFHAENLVIVVIFVTEERSL